MLMATYYDSTFKTDKDVRTTVNTKAGDIMHVITSWVGDNKRYDYETLVFAVDLNTGNVDYTKKYDVAVYLTSARARLGHFEVVKKWNNEIRDIKTLKYYT